ncbi:MAG: hypothetical protein JJU02_02600 [Cryomorphaceae bacterium]|nr:hypothetical protein [Cryomorphaceae bacterium]
MKYFNGFAFFMVVVVSHTIGCTKDDEELPKVKTHDISEITKTSAVVSGEVISDGGNLITQKGICLSATNTEPTINDVTSEEGDGGGSFSSYFGWLDPETTFYARAYATNSKGTGYGSTLTFTTLKEPGQSSVFIDPRDGFTYRTITYGNMVWMMDNMKFLPEVVGPDLIGFTTPMYYVYGYFGTDVISARQEINFSEYGVLYNWAAANSACPPGWHLPTDEEWEALLDFFGGKEFAGGRLKADYFGAWEEPNTGATNESKFHALPSGKLSIDNIFMNQGTNAHFWTATGFSASKAVSYELRHDTIGVIDSLTNIGNGYCVRCVLDNP